SKKTFLTFVCGYFKIALLLVALFVKYSPLDITFRKRCFRKLCRGFFVDKKGGKFLQIFGRKTRGFSFNIKPKSMAFAVLHLEKGKSNSGAIGTHIDR